MWFFSNKKKIAENNQKCDKLIKLLINDLTKTKELLQRNGFISINEITPLFNTQLIKYIKSEDLKQFKKTTHYQQLIKLKEQFLYIYTTQRKLVVEHNLVLMIIKLENAIKEIEEDFYSLNYIYNGYSRIIENKYNDIIEFVKTDSQINKSIKNYNRYETAKITFLNWIETLPKKIKQHNDYVFQETQQEAREIIGNVEGFPPDNQQLLAITKTPYNHLIVAGAGTGKTTTIVGKVKYLLKTKQCVPEDILVLSFTNASAYEMRERIIKETECDIEASTFHSFGLKIVSQIEEGKPNVIEDNKKNSILKKELDKNLKDENYRSKFVEYLMRTYANQKSRFSFNEEGDYNNWLKYNPPVTLKGEQVKSYGEMDIANFLYEHGIEYEYEKAYEIDTRDAEHSQYLPDFYLPEYGIYIEYFGINENGEVPIWFKGDGVKSASELYVDSIYWKRDTHEKNNTKFIECYAFERKNNSLFLNLKENLLKYGVKIEKKESIDIYNQFKEENAGAVKHVLDFIIKMIDLIKGNNYSLEYVQHLVLTHTSIDDLLLLDLIEPIYLGYQKYLKDNLMVDFADMINLAIKYIRNGNYIPQYKYVIVDEYQDIAKIRYELLYELRKKQNFNIFCVGDDWQSIYGFNGSNVHYILDFEHYWGDTEIDKIETTYRFNQKLIDASSKFIQENPNQIKKQIKGRVDNSNSFPIEEIKVPSNGFLGQVIGATLETLPENATVFFLGRYNSDLQELLKDGNLKINSVQSVNEEEKEIYYKNRTDLKMKFLTVHRAKGLQADYIFIINNKDGPHGFPCKIKNPKIVELLLDNSEDFPEAEERRLYYVALTRAKEKVFFVTVSGQESSFANELVKTWKYELEKESKKMKCPLCGERLVLRIATKGTNIGHKFWGCINFGITGCRGTKNYEKEK